MQHLRNPESMVETMRFSSRVDISEPNPIAKAEAEAKANGITLGKLNDSNPTKHALASELLPDIYGAEPRGQRYAREALAAFLHEQGNTATADDLYILSSTSEAYSWLIKLLCNAGDAVLAPKPGYPLIESIARLECVDMIEYQQRFDGSWYIDVAELREALEGEDGGRIRALVLINPNNPTGSYVKASEREAIVRLCHDHEVAIIAERCSTTMILNHSMATRVSRGRPARSHSHWMGSRRRWPRHMPKWVGSKCPARRLKWMRPSADSTWSPTTICQ